VWDFVVKQKSTARDAMNEAGGDVARCYRIIDLWKLKINEVIKALRTELMNRGVSVDDALLHVLVAIDEARQFNVASGSRDRFGVFRRALQCLSQLPNGEGLNCFCVVTDTTSKISNLTPTIEVDYSFRDRSPLAGRGYRLFPPLTLANRTDIWWHAAKLVELPAGASVEDGLWKLRNQLVGPPPAEMNEVVPAIFRRSEEGAPVALVEQKWMKSMVNTKWLKSAEFMTMFGRASFYPFFRFRRAGGEEEAFSALLTLLKTKLLCQYPEDDPMALKKDAMLDEDDKPDFAQSRAVLVDPKMAYTQAQALSVLGAMVSIEVSAASKLASEIAAGHMRMVGAISKDRTFVYTLECPEPLLARAAHALVMEGVVPWYVLIRKYLRTQINNSTVDTGNKGEVIVQILTAMTWQKFLVKQPTVSFPSVSVFDFLTVLLGETAFRALIADSPTAAANFKRGFVRLNQIVRAFKDPTPSMLADFYVRSSGIACKQGFACLDFAFPIFYPCGEGALTPNDDWEDKSIDAGKTRVMGWQVKLWNGGTKDYEFWKWVETLPKLNKFMGSSTLPSVGIYFNLGAEENRLSFFEAAEKTRKRTHEGHPKSLPRDCPFKYAIKADGALVDNLKPGDDETIIAFKKLLTSHAKLVENKNIEIFDRERIPDVFAVAFDKVKDFVYF
jgi:hypothetical protein